jgi:hypothetical protein
MSLLETATSMVDHVGTGDMRMKPKSYDELRPHEPLDHACAPGVLQQMVDKVKAMTPDEQREAFEAPWRRKDPNYRRRIIAMLEQNGIVAVHRHPYQDDIIGLEFIKPEHPAAIAVLGLIAEEVGPPTRDENGELPLVVIRVI